MILHIDMDAFFASIEQAINPRLKGKPLIVGTRPNKTHTAVCAASYEAKELGIGAGMTSAEALRLCPQAEFVAADQSKYIWTSEQIFSILKTYEFPIDYASIDEFQMDIGSHPQPLELAKEIQERIKETFGISASVGIAKNWLLAKLASKINKPNGICLITDETLEAVLAKVQAKKLCGVGAKTHAILDSLGIKTCLDLYRQSAQFLKEHLGQAGLDFYAGLRATERLTHPEHLQKPKSISHSYTLPRATQNTGFIQAWIRLLSEMVGRRLREQNLLSNTVHLWLNGPEIGSLGAQQTFTQATNDSFEIYRRCLKIMAKTGKKMPKIRALGISCSNLLTNNYPPLLKEEKRRRDLIQAVDKINRKFAEHTVVPAIVKITEKMPVY